MNFELHKQLASQSGNLAAQLLVAGISEANLASFVIPKMKRSIEEMHREAWHTLVGMVYSMSLQEDKTDILCQLLLMPGHTLHQEITKELQNMAATSAVPTIREVLASEFSYLRYTASEDEVIAKWFSHALAKIGSTEALATIREFANSSNEGIRKEMSYRLEKIAVAND